MPMGTSTVSWTSVGNGRRETSSSNCCITVYPPPEYFQRLPGVAFQPDRSGIGGLLAIQDLNERGNRRARGIAGKTLSREPRGVREQLAQGDHGSRSRRARGN